MPIYPRPDQIKALLESDFEGPVAMLNLLEFKERAEYEDGRETDLSGREAYALYGRQMAPFVASKGGRLLHSSVPRRLVIGDGELEWDAVAIMEYPSKEAFVAIASAPEVASGRVPGPRAFRGCGGGCPPTSRRRYLVRFQEGWLLVGPFAGAARCGHSRRSFWAPLLTLFFWNIPWFFCSFFS